MSDEIKEAITKMAEATDGNEKAKYLLKGLQLGLEAARKPDEKDRPA